MPNMSKGTRAFGVFFIVYSCSMFLGRVTSILYHLIQSRVATVARRSYYYSDLSFYSTVDLIVDFVGLGLAIFVFFAALRILKLSKLALSSIKMTAAVGIGYNVFAIVKDAMKIINSASQIEWRSYMLAGGIATCLLSIGFWCFVLYFFNRTAIKEQFK